MSSKAQKELERQEEHKDSTALPTFEATQSMSAEERRAMRGMVVWNVSPPVAEEITEVLEDVPATKKSLGGWDELAKHSRRTSKRFSAPKKNDQTLTVIPVIPSHETGEVLETLGTASSTSSSSENK